MIRSAGTDLTRTTRSTSDGSFSFPDLPGSSSSVSIMQNGYTGQSYPAVQIQGDRTTTLSIRLAAAGSVSEQVIMQGTPRLNQTDTTNGYVFDHTQIQETPLATDSFTQLAVVAPGVSAELINSTGTNKGLGNQAIWANGQRATDDVFLVNGVDVSNLFNGDSTSQLASDRATPNTGKASRPATRFKPTRPSTMRSAMPSRPPALSSSKKSA